MNKGQLLTTDYVIGVMLFMLLLTACLYFWENTLYKMEQDRITMELLNTASRASDQLVRTPGNPNNWESNLSSLNSIGLASSDRLLSRQKFDALASMNYTNFRYYLGVGNYDVYLKISNSSGATLGDAGLVPSGLMVVNKRKVVTFENQTALLDVSVWTGEVGNVIVPIT